MPIIIGGLEASLRRFAHYDYWDDKVRRSILVDSGADMLVYGMAEYAEREIARRLKKKIPVSEMRDIRGTAFLAHDAAECTFDSVTLPSFADVCDSKRFYADATRIEYAEHDPVRGRALIQEHDGRYLIVNPPAMPLETKELDRVAELPYTKQYHPMYEPLGGVPAIEEVKFSVIHNRGCFGGKEVMIEGLLSIQAGENPRVIEEKLKSFLPPKDRTSADGEEEAGGEA